MSRPAVDWELQWDVFKRTRQAVPVYSPPELVRSPAEAAADSAIEHWARATRFRRALERQLRPHGLTFALWRMLHLADRLIREKDGDAVTQVELSDRSGLHPNTVSYAMRILGERALVDRAPDCDGNAMRTYLTSKGETILAATRTIAVEHGYFSPP